MKLFPVSQMILRKQRKNKGQMERCNEKKRMEESKYEKIKNR